MMETLNYLKRQIKKKDKKINNLKAIQTGLLVVVISNIPLILWLWDYLHQLIDVELLAIVILADIFAFFGGWAIYKTFEPLDIDPFDSLGKF